MNAAGAPGAVVDAPIAHEPHTARRASDDMIGVLLALPACIVLAACLVVPLGYVLCLSFNPPQLGVLDLVPTFTLRNYARFLYSPFYWRILGKTIYFAGISTLLAAAFGYLLSLAIWRASPRARGMMVIIVLSPLLVSIVTRTFGWMIVLGDNGLINATLMALGIIRQPLHLMFTDGAVIVGLTHVFLPLLVLPTLTALERIDPAVPQAAETLGAGRPTIALQVILPLASPGLVAGIAIVFSLAMSSYITPALIGGPHSDMITTLIYQQFVVTFNWQFGAVLVAVLLAASLIAVGLIFLEFGRRTRSWIVRA
jgi:putative spermidine/putrescine transport system permease protein